MEKVFDLTPKLAVKQKEMFVECFRKNYSTAISQMRLKERLLQSVTLVVHVNALFSKMQQVILDQVRERKLP